ncbi:MAG: hypothetical protein NHG36_00010 [Chromatiaceae bacterium]|nr:hypothetical protein [Candidatus Thioaporhodococcus sediminis]
MEEQQPNVDPSTTEQAVDTTQEGSGAAPTNPPTDTDTGSPKGEESGDQEEGIVTDEAGNKFIPHDRVEKIIAARLAKMAEQKNAAVSDVIEAGRADPGVRKQILEAFGVQEAAASEQVPEEPEVSEFDSFLESNVPKDHHAHYKAFFDAMDRSIERKLRASLESAVSPILQHIGRSETQRFAKEHKDYDRYAGKIQEAIRSGRAKTLEDAYRLVSYDDHMRGAGASAIKSEADRKAKLAGTPIRRTSGVPGAAKPQFKSFREALEYHAQKQGMDS